LQEIFINIEHIGYGVVVVAIFVLTAAVVVAIVGAEIGEPFMLVTVIFGVPGI
jgi:hypothetical protein